MNSKNIISLSFHYNTWYDIYRVDITLMIFNWSINNDFSFEFPIIGFSRSEWNARKKFLMKSFLTFFLNLKKVWYYHSLFYILNKTTQMLFYISLKLMKMLMLCNATFIFWNVIWIYNQQDYVTLCILREMNSLSSEVIKSYKKKYFAWSSSVPSHFQSF